MTLNDLRRVLEVAVNRPDVSDLYDEWCRQAVRSLCQGYNWSAMKSTVDVTVSSGQSSVRLPDSFKELQKARPPVWSYSTSRQTWLPCEVADFAGMQRADAAFPGLISASTSAECGQMSVDVSRDVTGKWFLNTIAPLTLDVAFRVKCYVFPPDLVKDTDSNFLLQDYPEMVKAAVKAVAFEELNDPEAVNAETLLAVKKQAAKAADAYAEVAGKRMQMGG